METRYTFSETRLPPAFHWLNEPTHYATGAGLQIWTDAGTDFWQRTHYGFRRDDGHALLLDAPGDFTVTTQVQWQPSQQYDQCGLMVRLDAENWIKLSTEYEGQEPSRLGSVVTNLGYSDWATQDVDSALRMIWYRISRRGHDFLLEAALDGESWQQLRITHLHRAAGAVAVGPYTCSPTGREFWSRFHYVARQPNCWLVADDNIEGAA